MAARQFKIIPFVGLLLLIFMVLGLSAATLTTTDFALEGKKVKTEEATLGNLVADAVRQAGEADIALVNASQMREIDIPAGAVTDSQIQRALAYPDEKLAVMELPGGTIRDCMERGLRLLPKPNKGFLQVSGMSVKYDSARPVDRRVVEIKLGKEELKNNETYDVAMPHSLARGAGGYFTILNGVEFEELDTTLLQAVTSYLSERGARSARVGDRLVDIAEEEKE